MGMVGVGVRDLRGLGRVDAKAQRRDATELGIQNDQRGTRGECNRGANNKSDTLTRIQTHTLTQAHADTDSER